MLRQRPPQAALLALIVLAACARTEYRYERVIVGGRCTVEFRSPQKKQAAYALQTIDAELERLDSLFSYFNAASLVSAVNRDGRVLVPPEYHGLFVMCDSVSRLTGGRFDITVAPILDLWGFYDRNARVPSADQIRAARARVGFRRVRLAGDSLLLSPGTRIDLAGIVQGYAADRVASILRDHGITAAVINIAGEIVCLGRATDERGWRIGIQHPRAGGIIETIELEDQALSTSGDYENYLLIEGQRFPHIIDPLTGSPARSFASVTIIGRSAAYTDALATAVAAMGMPEGVDFIKAQRIRAILYYEENGELRRIETP